MYIYNGVEMPVCYFCKPPRKRKERAREAEIEAGSKEKETNPDRNGPVV